MRRWLVSSQSVNLLPGIHSLQQGESSYSVLIQQMDLAGVLPIGNGAGLGKVSDQHF